MKKICFMILVHENKSVIRDMLNNIRYFCPNSSIFLYNGSDDPSLCDGLGVPVCPTSRKLNYGFHATFFLEVMEWLTEMKVRYDYLINLDSDAVFAKKGYEQFIAQRMEGCEYMGSFIQEYDSRWGPVGYYPGNRMLEEWGNWWPIFESDIYYSTFCVGQVFSRKTVGELLHHPKLGQIKSVLTYSNAWGVEEILFVTLIKQMGYVTNTYQWDHCNRIGIRYRPHFTKLEVKEFLSEDMHYLFHPVFRNIQDEARVFIRNLMFKDTKELEYCVVNSFYRDVNLIDNPPFIGLFQLTEYQTYLKINDPSVIPCGNSVYLQFQLSLPDQAEGNLEIGLVNDYWHGGTLTFKNKPGSIPFVSFKLCDLKKGEVSLDITRLIGRDTIPSFQLRAPQSELIRLSIPVLKIVKEKKG